MCCVGWPCAAPASIAGHDCVCGVGGSDGDDDALYIPGAALVCSQRAGPAVAPSRRDAVVDPGQRDHAPADAGQPGAARPRGLDQPLARARRAGGGHARRRGPAVGPTRLPAPRRAAARERRADHEPSMAARCRPRPRSCAACPGVGSYTAAAVASFAYGQRHAVLDTNVRRVLARLVIGDSCRRSGADRGGSPTGRVAAAAGRQARRAVVGRASWNSARWSALRRARGALTARSAASAPGSGAAGPRSLARRAAARYEGSDRQCRGRLLAVLRSAAGRCRRVDAGCGLARLRAASACARCPDR